MSTIYQHRSWVTAATISSIALALVAAAGCGGDDAATAVQALEPADFLGSWSYTGGTVRIECPGIPVVSVSLEEVDSEPSAHFELGTASDLVVIDEENDCPLAANIDGNRAIAAAGQSCTYVDEDGDQITETVLSYTFTVSGQTGHEEAQLTMLGITDDGSTCTGTLAADLRKL